jgi:hypothetical protein
VVTEVLNRRESKKRSDSGIVFFRHVGYNQRDEIVCECKRAGLMLKRADYEALQAKMKADAAAAKQAAIAEQAASAEQA